MTSLENRVGKLERGIMGDGAIPAWAMEQARSEAELERFREAGSKALGEAILRDNPGATLKPFQKRFHTAEDIEEFARVIGEKYPDRKSYLADRPPMDIAALRRIFRRAG